MIKFSANLGFLWADLSLPDAIHAAKDANFKAVECHWPYDEDPDAVRRALEVTGLTMISINTRKGIEAIGDFGLAALPEREEEAKNAIDEAILYADYIGAKKVHVLAGNTDHSNARAVFVSNLQYAARKAAPKGLSVLIEPLNGIDNPNYFLTNTQDAVNIILAVGASNLKLMFDCYHVEKQEGDVLKKLERYFQLIGHIQIAGVPSRCQPSEGDLDYIKVCKMIAALGYDEPIGAEYFSSGLTEHSLGWMKTLAT